MSSQARPNTASGSSTQTLSTAEVLGQQQGPEAVPATQERLTFGGIQQRQSAGEALEGQLRAIDPDADLTSLTFREVGWENWEFDPNTQRYTNPAAPESLSVEEFLRRFTVDEEAENQRARKRQRRSEGLRQGRRFNREQEFGRRSAGLIPVPVLLRLGLLTGTALELSEDLRDWGYDPDHNRFGHLFGEANWTPRDRFLAQYDLRIPPAKRASFEDADESVPESQKVLVLTVPLSVQGEGRTPEQAARQDDFNLSDLVDDRDAVLTVFGPEPQPGYYVTFEPSPGVEALVRWTSLQHYVLDHPDLAAVTVTVHPARTVTTQPPPQARDLLIGEAEGPVRVVTADGVEQYLSYDDVFRILDEAEGRLEAGNLQSAGVECYAADSQFSPVIEDLLSALVLNPAATLADIAVPVTPQDARYGVLRDAATVLRQVQEILALLSGPAVPLVEVNVLLESLGNAVGSDPCRALLLSFALDAVTNNAGADDAGQEAQGATTLLQVVSALEAIQDIYRRTGETRYMRVVRDDETGEYRIVAAESRLSLREQEEPVAFEQAIPQGFQAQAGLPEPVISTVTTPQGTSYVVDRSRTLKGSLRPAAAAAGSSGNDLECVNLLFVAEAGDGGEVYEEDSVFLSRIDPATGGQQPEVQEVGVLVAETNEDYVLQQWPGPEALRPVLRNFPRIEFRMLEPTDAVYDSAASALTFILEEQPVPLVFRIVDVRCQDVDGGWHSTRGTTPQVSLQQFQCGFPGMIVRNRNVQPAVDQILSLTRQIRASRGNEAEIRRLVAERLRLSAQVCAQELPHDDPTFQANLARQQTLVSTSLESDAESEEGEPEEEEPEVGGPGEQPEEQPDEEPEEEPEGEPRGEEPRRGRRGQKRRQFMTEEVDEAQSGENSEVVFPLFGVAEAAPTRRNEQNLEGVSDQMTTDLTGRNFEERDTGAQAQADLAERLADLQDIALALDVLSQTYPSSPAISPAQLQQAVSALEARLQNAGQGLQGLQGPPGQREPLSQQAAQNVAAEVGLVATQIGRLHPVLCQGRMNQTRSLATVNADPALQRVVRLLSAFIAAENVEDPDVFFANYVPSPGAIRFSPAAWTRFTRSVCDVRGFVQQVFIPAYRAHVLNLAAPAATHVPTSGEASGQREVQGLEDMDYDLLSGLRLLQEDGRGGSLDLAAERGRNEAEQQDVSRRLSLAEAHGARALAPGVVTIASTANLNYLLRALQVIYSRPEGRSLADIVSGVREQFAIYGVHLPPQADLTGSVRDALNRTDNGLVRRFVVRFGLPGAYHYIGRAYYCAGPEALRAARGEPTFGAPCDPATESPPATLVDDLNRELRRRDLPLVPAFSNPAA